MDWRNNAWVGIGAAGLLVIFIIVIVWYITGGGPSAIEQGAVGLQFQCESCGGRFRVELAEVEDWDVYEKYMRPWGSAVPCRLCGEETAYKVYYCPECDKWYRYTPGMQAATSVVCPEGHVIPEEHQ